MTTAIDVIGLGELLWDCFPDGRRPGGAPANVAFHAQQLGLTASVATRVGGDALGSELEEFLRGQQLSTTLVQRDPGYGTGTVTVQPAGTSTSYVFLENSAWDFLELKPPLLDAARRTRAICFGTLAQRSPVSRRTIHECVAATSDDCVRVYDVNLRPPFVERTWIEASLQLATVAKLNDDEAELLAEMLGAPTDSVPAFASWLRDQFELDLVCVTRGAHGALAVTAEERCEVPGLSISVVDTVGAGDAFTAGIIASRLRQWPLATSLEFANRLGAAVASRAGAMPVLDRALLATAPH